MFRDILVVTTGRGYYQHLVGRGPGCCQTSFSAQDPTGNYLVPKVNSALSSLALQQLPGSSTSPSLLEHWPWCHFAFIDRNDYLMTARPLVVQKLLRDVSCSSPSRILLPVQPAQACHRLHCSQARQAQIQVPGLPPAGSATLGQWCHFSEPPPFLSLRVGL